MSSTEHSAPAVPHPNAARGTLLSQTLILAGRNLTKLRTSPQIVVFSVLQPIIMMMLFMVLFAGAVSGSQAKYLQFLLPGMLAQNAAFMVTTVGQAINSDMEKGIFDRFRSLPIARPAPLVAHILGDMPRQAAATVVILLFGVCVGFRVHTDPLSVGLAVLLVLLVSFAFSWIALTIGLVADKPESVNMLVMILLFPMAFGSNTMVATDTLPGWLQAWAKINPVTHLTDAVRALLTGPASDAGSAVGATLLACGVVFAVFVPLAIRAYSRRL
ncbi:ABC transporter permease [Streptomyces sp. SCA3-4]|uniref:ABC transporter permease n=1 Tax=Streptomyces sichuanensis TaxID=2871810 RepID=UPI001CE396F3|nr:ABC transporter permease [Streptomyces sichuanensis]MCA6094663.1 ABC transporter permease [Streptomyces sichuanensis]